MKVVIQIPCFNEEGFIGATLDKLPREIPGIDVVEWLIIDDGSSDRTIAEAVAHGADHVVKLPNHKGLARAFMAGIEASLSAGADIIVNTDADNQYFAGDIPRIIDPILNGKAEIVVGTRDIDKIEDFSPTKKLLQKLGTFIVRIASNTDIADATSGFRAISRKAARQLNVFTRYTYTIETLIQAGQKGINVTSVPIRVNRRTRPSRLIKSIPSYLFQSAVTIVRIFVIYRPFRFLMAIGSILFGAGFLIGLRFLLLFIAGKGSGHVQSLILAAILFGMGFQTILIGFLADLLAANRRLLEDIRYKMTHTERNTPNGRQE